MRTEYILVYETFSGYKIEEYEKHSKAFKEYESIIHSQKGIYTIERINGIISPINISFSPFEKECQEVKKLLLEKYRSFTWLN